MANKPQARLNFVKDVYGDNWKKLRESKNKTVREFATIVNMSYSSISKIENEIDFPTIEQINIYQKRFNVSLDYLVGLTETKDIELSRITELTGLSEKAIKNIRSFPFSEIHSSDLSRYLESVDLIDFISTFQDFISEYEEMERTADELDEKIDALEDDLYKYEDEEQFEDYDETDDSIIYLRQEKNELKDRHDFLIWKMEKSIKNFVENAIKDFL